MVNSQLFVDRMQSPEASMGATERPKPFQGLHQKHSPTHNFKGAGINPLL